MKTNHLTRITFGAIVIISGIIVLLNSFGLIDVSWWSFISTWWPVVFIAIGLTSLISGQKFFPLFLIALSIAIILRNLDIIDLNIWSIAFATIVISAGIKLILPKKPRHSSSINRVDNTAILSGFSGSINSDHFEGGDITTILGGTELDLRGAKLAPKASLTITAVLGGVELRVPEDWDVVITGTPILGGWDKKIHKPTDKSHTLKINATCILGGVEVKN